MERRASKDCDCCAIECTLYSYAWLHTMRVPNDEDEANCKYTIEMRLTAQSRRRESIVLLTLSPSPSSSLFCLSDWMNESYAVEQQKKTFIFIAILSLRFQWNSFQLISCARVLCSHTRERNFYGLPVRRIYSTPSTLRPHTGLARNALEMLLFLFNCCDLGFSESENRKRNIFGVGHTVPFHEGASNVLCSVWLQLADITFLAVMDVEHISLVIFSFFPILLFLTPFESC